MNNPSDPASDNTSTSGEGRRGRRALLREVARLAVAQRPKSAIGPATTSPQLRAAEDRAHAAGIAWTDIDRVRVTGMLNERWTADHTVDDPETEARDFLLTEANLYAGVLRDMIVIETLLNHTRKPAMVSVSDENALAQYRRNVPAVHRHVQTIAGLIDPSDTEAAGLRAALSEHWDRSMNAKLSSLGNAAALDAARSHYTGAELQTRSDRVAGSLRQHSPFPAHPAIASLESAKANADQAARTVLDRHTGPQHALPPGASRASGTGEAITTALAPHTTTSAPGPAPQPPPDSPVPAAPAPGADL